MWRLIKGKASFALLAASISKNAVCRKGHNLS